MSGLNDAARARRATAHAAIPQPVRKEPVRTEAQIAQLDLDARAVALDRLEDDQYLRVAQALGLLTDLLVASGTEPAAWVNYESHPQPLHSRTTGGRSYVDAIAKVSLKRKRLHVPPSRMHVPTGRIPQYFEAWPLFSKPIHPSETARATHEVTHAQHNLLASNHRMLFVAEQWRVIDLTTIHNDNDARRLRATRQQPRSLAEQIVNTVVHYNLDWPTDATMIDDIVPIDPSPDTV